MRKLSFIIGLSCLCLALCLTLGCRQRRLPKRLEGKERIIVTIGGIRDNRSQPLPGTRFADVAQTAGLHYTWKMEGGNTPNILQTIGNGCAFLDYDNDSNLDVLLVGQPHALYHGDGKGNFTDVTEAMGLSSLKGRFLGCAVGDVDGDGFDDLYISGYETGVLLRNDAGKRFTDITSSAGLKPQPWGTSCAFGETIPGSGRLDLYVAGYVIFGPKTEPQLCDSPNGPQIACGPEEYEPRRGTFYQNKGHSQFTDITESAGFSSANGKGLGVAFANLAGDKRLYLLVENDGMPGDMFELTADGGTLHAKNVSTANGTALDRDGNTHAGMGVDVGDVNNDGKLDVFVTTFAGEPRSLYCNNGDVLFSDRGMSAGFSPTQNVAFGCKFLDFDNDGWLDIVQVNGHPQKNIERIREGTSYRQGSQLFHNVGSRELGFDDVSVSSPDFQKKIVGRGVAVGDYDNDGREDILIADSDGAPQLLHNESTNTGHWLGVRLIGKKSNRDGYGALLTARVGKQTLLRTCQSCGSYLSASDKRVHFGLGAASRVDTVTVSWPSGRVDTFSHVPTDRYITITEGDTALR